MIDGSGSVNRTEGFRVLAEGLKTIGLLLLARCPTDGVNLSLAGEACYEKLWDDEWPMSLRATVLLWDKGLCVLLRRA